MKKLLTLLLLLTPVSLHAQSQIDQFQILQLGQQTATPANPPANSAYIYFNSSGTAVCIKSNGSSCFASSGGGTPGGSDTQLQYNNVGAFGGISGSVWNSSTSQFSLTTTATGNAQGQNTFATTFTGSPNNGTEIGFYAYAQGSPTADYNGSFTGVKAAAFWLNAFNESLRLVGLETQVQNNNTGTVTLLEGIRNSITQTAAGTITTGIGNDTFLTQNSGTITNLIGTRYNTPTNSGGTLTHNYAIRIEDQSQSASGGTNADPWGLFEVSTTEKNQLGRIFLNSATASRPAYTDSNKELVSGAFSGNTTTFATTSGTLTSAHIASFDASGNIVDGGAAPASGPGYGANYCTTSTFSCAARFNVIANQLIVATCSYFTNGAGAGVPSISDTLGLSWTQIATVFQSGNSRGVTSWYSNPGSTTGADTFTCANTVSISFGGFTANLVTGATVASPTDGNATTTGNASNFDMTVTTTVDNDLMFFVSENGSSLTFAPVASLSGVAFPGPWTMIVQDTGQSFTVAYRKLSKAGPYYAQANMGGNYAVMTFAIK